MHAFVCVYRRASTYVYVSMHGTFTHSMSMHTATHVCMHVFRVISEDDDLFHSLLHRELFNVKGHLFAGACTRAPRSFPPYF